jgi:hypothetical protein
MGASTVNQLVQAKGGAAGGAPASTPTDGSAGAPAPADGGGAASPPADAGASPSAAPPAAGDPGGAASPGGGGAAAPGSADAGTGAAGGTGPPGGAGDGPTIPTAVAAWAAADVDVIRDGLTAAGATPGPKGGQMDAATFAALGTVLGPVGLAAIPQSELDADVSTPVIQASRGPLPVQRSWADLDNLVQAGAATWHDILNHVANPISAEAEVEVIVALMKKTPTFTPVDEKLVRHYVSGGGAVLVLTPQDMQDCLPSINLFSGGFPAISTARNTQLNILNAGPSRAGPALPGVQLNDQGLAGSGSRAGLGTFTAIVVGTLTTTPARAAAFTDFTGTVQFKDYWDFDPKPFQSMAGQSGRTAVGEILTEVLAAGLFGQPFDVTSAQAPIHQVAPGDAKATVG